MVIRIRTCFSPSQAGGRGTAEGGGGGGQGGADGGGGGGAGEPAAARAALLLNVHLLLDQRVPLRHPRRRHLPPL